MPRQAFTRRKRGGGFFNFLKKGVNRLRGRTARVQPAPQAQPQKKKVYNHEDFKEAFQRMLWYFIKRSEGHSHQSLERYLDIPGSFVVSTQDYDEIRRDIVRSLEEDFAGNSWEMAEFLKKNLFRSENFDYEWDNFEKAIRTGEENNRPYLLYRGTRVEKKPWDNVANGLHRFINLLVEFDENPSMLNYRTNYTQLGCNWKDNFIIFSARTVRKLINDGGDMTLDRLIILPDEYRLFVPGTATASPNGCFQNILSMYSMTRAITNRQIQLMTPEFGYRFMEMYPDLYAQAFGTMSGWESMSPLDRMRMLTVCFIAGRYVLATTGDANQAQLVYFSYPNPAFQILDGIPDDDSYWETIDLEDYFERMQNLVAKDNSSKRLTYQQYRSKFASYESNRAQLLGSRQAALNAITGVAYNADTELTNVNRLAWYKAVFKNKSLPFNKKALARTFIETAKQQTAQPFMTNAELTSARAQFGVNY